jgi:hypothetical protein
LQWLLNVSTTVFSKYFAREMALLLDCIIHWDKLNSIVDKNKLSSDAFFHNNAFASSETCKKLIFRFQNFKIFLHWKKLYS